MTFSCFVPGSPQSQGGTVPLKNKRTGRVNQVTTGSKNLGTWRKILTQVFTLKAKQTGHVTITGPVRVTKLFLMPRLKKHPLHIQGRFWAETALDLDKLDRAVNDSLTKAGIYVDDSRICVSQSMKRYAGLEQEPGVLVTVTALNDTVAELEEIFPTA